ncbi:conserved Plasmodium protein, unknown function [Plasmodium malariae]|uniref:Uncharacterized protein n=1 Tax=Plasmodium malariae TaxID=5858 RepID=A0A1C3KCS8_PLAMA|nr:conserved Plasmodium protein, unknown function [Plasmodium malariae]
MWKKIFQIFIFFIFFNGISLILCRKICNVVQFGSYTLSLNKENKKYFKYEVVGIIDPFDRNKILWSRKKRNRKFDLNPFKNIYDRFFCNINDYVYVTNRDQFIFRIFHINLKNTIKYMLKYKIIRGKMKGGKNGENTILCLKETSKLYRFLNNINI